jgi:uncharacterized protein
MADPVVQWQIIATDPEAVTRFYGTLFGWKTSTGNALGYREVDTGEHGVPGGVWPAPPGATNFVQLFVRVDDVAQCVAEASRLGATTIVPPAALPDGQTMAILRDPHGMPFGIMTGP